MIEFTENNYMQRTGNSSNFCVNLVPAKRKVKSYYEETIYSIEKIYYSKTGKFQVLYSGGVDSQYVCEVLLRLKINFDPVVVRLTNNFGELYNQHDIVYAFDFCKNRGLVPKVIDINFDDFVESGKICEVAESMSCSRFAICATAYASSLLDGYVIISDGDPYLRCDTNNVWSLVEFEYVHSLVNYYQNKNINGTPYILSYTPEMRLAWLLDPNIVSLGSGKIPGKTSSHSTKSRVYNNKSDFLIEEYDFVTKKRIKHTGYEKIYMSEWMNHPNIKKFKKYKKLWDGESVVPYYDVIKLLTINQ